MKIDTTTPIPERRKTKYPFDKMEVGHSFSFGKELRNSVLTAAAHFVKNYQPEWKFSTKTSSDKKMKCFRIK